MNTFKNQMFDEERAFYGTKDTEVIGCKFDGPADGESAFKECSNIVVRECFFNLRYPFWHVHGLRINESELTEKCRAALWYSDDIIIENVKLHGIKALRECSDVRVLDCDILSPEFGWSVKNIKMENTTATSEYFFMRAENIALTNVNFTGKYSFQYVKKAVFDNCTFNTKDAFWHGNNIIVKNSVIKGEYLAWYSDGVVLENCKIVGTQPFCYCKNLKLINCEMIDTDLCFEKSEVEAIITSSVISIKNPLSGKIKVQSVGKIIRDDENSKVQIITSEK